MASEQLKLEVKSGLAILTLANPDMNRLSLAVLDGLSAAAPRLRGDDVRAVMLNAEGPAFSYGADVKALFVDVTRSELQRLLERYLAFIAEIEALPKPTIAVVHGVCSSGGLELVLAFDYLWAAAGTKIGFKEPTLGIAPLAGGVQRIASRAGSARAMEIATLGNMYDAEIFERWNIVNRVLSPESLHTEAEAFGLKLAAGPTRALGAIKALINAHKAGVAAANKITVRTGMPLMDSEDATMAVSMLMKTGSLTDRSTFVGK